MTIAEALKVAIQNGWTPTKPAPTGVSTEEALRQLKAAGYTIQAPTMHPPAQRKTMVEGANTQRTAPQRTNPNIYRSGDYLREKLKSADWHELADRSRPLPTGISPSHLVKEFAQLLAGIIEDNYN